MLSGIAADKMGAGTDGARVGRRPAIRLYRLSLQLHFARCTSRGFHPLARHGRPDTARFGMRIPRILNRLSCPKSLPISGSPTLRCLRFASACEYIYCHPPHNAAWLAPAVAYGNALGIRTFNVAILMVLNNATNAEARLGNLFFIVTCNPVNICRAPNDIYRNGVPGTNLDYLVLNYLRATPAAAANPAWMAAATTLAKPPGAPALPALTPVPIPPVPSLTCCCRGSSAPPCSSWHPGVGSAARRLRQ
jgi:hypothetical protein